MDRSQGRDDAELEREDRQRAVQQGRAGGWRAGGGLLSYQQLYALWEKQNWKAHELDFSVDQEQWLHDPRGAADHRPGASARSTSGRSA